MPGKEKEEEAKDEETTRKVAKWKTKEAVQISAKTGHSAGSVMLVTWFKVGGRLQFLATRTSVWTLAWQVGVFKDRFVCGKMTSEVGLFANVRWSFRVGCTTFLCNVSQRLGFGCGVRFILREWEIPYNSTLDIRIYCQNEVKPLYS